MHNMKLQAARAASNKTQKRVASEAGISERLYQSYEYNKRRPSVDIAIRIADALNIVDLRKLFGDDDRKSTTK